MEKPSIRIPHPASFWFVVICLGGGASVSYTHLTLPTIA